MLSHSLTWELNNATGGLPSARHSTTPFGKESRAASGARTLLAAHMSRLEMVAACLTALYLSTTT